MAHQIRTRRKLVSGALAALLAVASTHALGQSSCPQFVELQSGTSLNLARLILDTGSPEAALRRLRVLFGEASDRGCPPRNKQVECEETLAVTKKAISTLERCVPGSQQGSQPGPQPTSRPASKPAAR